MCLEQMCIGRWDEKVGCFANAGINLSGSSENKQEEIGVVTMGPPLVFYNLPGIFLAADKGLCWASAPQRHQARF